MRIKDGLLFSVLNGVEGFILRLRVLHIKVRYGSLDGVAR